MLVMMNYAKNFADSIYKSLIFNWACINWSIDCHLFLNKFVFSTLILSPIRLPLVCNILALQTEVFSEKQRSSTISPLFLLCTCSICVFMRFCLRSAFLLISPFAHISRHSTPCLVPPLPPPPPQKRNVIE